MFSRMLDRMAANYNLYRSYWASRRAFRRISFLIGTVRFGVRDLVRNLTINASILLQLLRITVGSTVLAVAFLGVLLFSVRYGGVVDPANGASYDSTLTAIAGVVGVFLSLYFTSINTIIGTIYAKLPSTLRKLIISERVGSVSVTFLVFLTILCLLLLGVAVIWGLRPVWGIGSALSLGVFAILAFAQLSRRAFAFFDPTIFADQLLGDLARWCRQATARGYLWRDPSFQDYYRKQAFDALIGIRALAEVADAEDHVKREPLGNVVSRIAVFCSVYVGYKQLIPPDSRWYALVPKYRAWYLTTDIAVRSATATHTNLPPELKPDAVWLERELLDLVILTISKCLADGRKDTGLRILSGFDLVFDSLGRTFNVSQGVDLADRLRQAVQLFLNQGARVGLSVDRQTQTREKLGVMDVLGLAPISVMLGFFQTVKEINIDQLTPRIDQLNWRDARSLYLLGMPAIGLERLEFIQSRLDFEVRAEGKAISPPWYLTQLICQPLAQALKAQLDDLIRMGHKCYVAEILGLIAEGKHLKAAALVTRGLEYHHKLLAQLPHAENLAAGLERTRILPTLPWPSWDWEAARNSVIENQRQILVAFAECIPGLAEIRSSDELPDYFGHAVHTAGEQCYSALLNNDVTLFSNLFPHYHMGVIAVADKLKAVTGDWSPRDAVAIYSDPVLDLIDLSGYAKIFAELHQEPRFWQTCQARWDEYMERRGKGNVVHLLAAILALRSTDIRLTSRSILRTQWELNLGQMLRSLPRRLVRPKQRFPRARSIDIVEVIDHPSLLIRLIAGSHVEMMIYHKASNVFVDSYFMAVPEAEGVDFGLRDSIREALERWRAFERDATPVAPVDDSPEDDDVTSSTESEDDAGEEPL